MEHLAKEPAVVIDRLVVGEKHLQVPEHVDEDEAEQHQTRDGHDDFAAYGGAGERIGTAHRHRLCHARAA
jgi:hypothetical protein